LVSICFIACANGLATPLNGEEETLTQQGYEREESGVNPYTAPAIARIFQQLDDLRPLPFEQLRREFPKVSPPNADGLKRADVKSIHERAREVNAAIRQID